ncbi:MAG: VOC family protein [Thermoleophilaceae bacterium]|nr:VOC family protein [Thermoleophilaceae bacterium]
MGERTAYTDGIFCWVELATTDTDGAREFYSGLLGWDYDEAPIPDGSAYITAKLGDKSVGAMYAQGEDQRAVMPPNWLNYVKTSDADGAAAKAGELGGSVEIGPFDVMEHGRMAVLKDPQGAYFAVWQPNAHLGAQVVNGPGALSWNQLNTSNVDGAKSFYTELFGWAAEEVDPESGYFVWKVGEGLNGGGLGIGDGDPSPPNWTPIFGHADLAGAIEQIASSGGTVITDTMEVPGGGKFFAASDPQGAVFALFEGDYDD